MKMIALLLCLIPSVACADQFGLRMGMSLDEIRQSVTIKKEKGYQYSAANVPNGHPELTDYRLLVTPQHGLCKIVAWTDPIQSSRFGEDVKSKFDEFFDALSSKYGRTKKYDFVRSGSLWDEPQDWMMGLKEGDRYLAAFWSTKDSQLPADITTIKLQAEGVTSDTALISVGYEFANASDCIDWVRTQRDSSL